jgi:hypothetical protein
MSFIETKLDELSSRSVVMIIECTEHAKIRMQQRAISEDMLDTLLTFGKARFNGNGTEIVTFPKQVIKRLKANIPKEKYVAIERHMNLYAVLSTQGDLITAGYRTRKLKLH